MSDLQSSNFPRCSAHTNPSNKFCASCGSKLLPDDERRAVDAYVKAQIEGGVAEQTKDKDLVAVSPLRRKVRRSSTSGSVTPPVSAVAFSVHQNV